MTTHAEFQMSLHGLLDGELDAANAARCEEHLAVCPECAAQYAEMTELRDAIRTSAPRYSAPKHLRQRVRASLHRAQPRGAGDLARRLSWPAAALMAASIGLFTLAPRGPDIGDEIVSSHVRSLMANHLIDVASSDHHTVKPWFAGHVDFSPPIYDLASQGYALAGGRVDYIDGHPVAAVVYRHGPHIINLFIWPAHPGAALASSRTEEGYNVRHWTKLGMTCWAVSDMNAQELQRFEQLVKNQTPI